MKKVLIIYGTSSYEHDVSILSARTIKENIDYDRYDVSFCYINKKNDWYIENKPIDNIVAFLKQFDVVFPMVHGMFGEDGKLEGLFETFGIKYVGSNLESSIISYDKALTKIILEKYHIPQAPYFILNKKDKVINKLPYPVIVKPARCGSSIGISICQKKCEYKKALKKAFKYDDKVVVEAFLNIRELECSVIFDEKFKTGKIGEIISSNQIYDYEAKYEKKSKLVIPAELDSNVTKNIKKMALKIVDILNIKNYARLDFMLDKNNNLYFNEINTIPGFTNISMFLKLLEDSNRSIKRIITDLIENA